MSYGISRDLSLDYEDAVEKTRDALKSEGFGVLTEIDIRATLKEKLGVDFRRYVILGACNPPLAHRALQAEREIGLLLPCNVIVYERGEGSTVSAIEPSVMLGVVENEQVESIAEEVREKLTRALDSIAG